MSVVLGPTLWQFNQNYPLGGNALLGGRVICKNGGIIWIVAPASSQVSRTWTSRNNAITTATACTSSNTWFVPTASQLQNPGYTCRTRWDSFSINSYWSNESTGGTTALIVNFANGTQVNTQQGGTFEVRAFRCVTY